MVKAVKTKAAQLSPEAQACKDAACAEYQANPNIDWQRIAEGQEFDRQNPCFDMHPTSKHAALKLVHELYARGFNVTLICGNVPQGDPFIQWAYQRDYTLDEVKG